MQGAYAGYASACEGRKISMPDLPPPGGKRNTHPNLWLNGAGPAHIQAAQPMNAKKSFVETLLPSSTIRNIPIVMAVYPLADESRLCRMNGFP